ncbi:MAG: cytochrome P450, partial [Proteobacteria bacterium]|nr:cytochrome P450 [Pseudomonadota bacterium]
DFELPQGSFVMPIIASANRDEARFEEPDRFDVHRNAQGHLAFGLGNHFCLGTALARLEAKVVLENILERLPNLRLAGDVSRHGSFLVRGPSALPLHF